MSMTTAHQRRREGKEHGGERGHRDPLGVDSDDPLSGHVGDAWSLAVAGSPSPLPYRHEMEERFGEDFSRVRAFLGRPGPMEAIGAHAATRGEDVVFAERAPSKKLVAHELTHVVQRRRGASGVVRKSLRLSQPGDAAEREAERVAEQVAHGSGAAVKEAPAGLLHRNATTLQVTKVPVVDNTRVYDGAGTARPITLTGNVSINRVRVAKDIDPTRPGTYFFVRGSSGGWIHASDIRWKSDSDEYKHLLKLTQKVEGTSTKMKTIAGGPQKQRAVKSNRPSGFQDMRVNKEPSGKHQLAADYLIHPGRGLNLVANVPEHTNGTFGPRGAENVDLLPEGTTFIIKTSQRAVFANLYKWYNTNGSIIKEGEDVGDFKKFKKKSTKMKFVYGYAKFASGRHSWGWVADSALKPG